MKHLRRLGLAFTLALALLFGEQAAALHDLGHGLSQIAHKGSLPPGSTCDQCFACAQLSGAVAATVPMVPPFDARDAVPACVAPASAPPALRLAFRSRAPPTLL